CLAGPVPPTVQGLREHSGEFTGVDAAGGVPEHGAPNCPCQGQAKREPCSGVSVHETGKCDFRIGH
ncbi:MAG: hypothetical protein OXC41_07980, partial [Gammaproteobacteria bacterium]|nr:hypothetical protein [Gammaproteobacteria bacterium]